MKNAINIGLAVLMVFVIGACDGKEKEPKSVKIGEQIWMAENLNDPSKGGKCYEDKPENCEKYGRLYTWEEAKKACPSGWHLPSSGEWGAIRYDSEEKLKAKSGWDEYEGKSNGTDDYGFSALPGGIGYSHGVFAQIGYGGFWWDSEDYGGIYIRNGSCSSADDCEAFYDESFGRANFLSVRCIKD